MLAREMVFNISPLQSLRPAEQSRERVRRTRDGAVRGAKIMLARERVSTISLASSEVSLSTYRGKPGGA